jgi:ribosomal protein L33
MKKGERIKLRINIGLMQKGSPMIKVLGIIKSCHNEFGIENYVLEISKKYNLLKLHLLKYQEKQNEGLSVEVEKEGKILKAFLRVENNTYLLTSRFVYNYIKKETISIYIPKRNRRIGSVKVKVHKNDKGFILQSDELLNLADSNYHIVFRGKFFESKKVGNLIYFTRSNLLK